MLFRIAAFGEAIGWTLLLIGIAIQRYVLTMNQVPVLITGRIHGMLFLIYALAAIGLYPTLHWSRHRACIAFIASIPPYGSLIFEQWASRNRKHEQLMIFQNCIFLAAVSSMI